MDQLCWITEDRRTGRERGIGEAVETRIVERELIEHAGGVVRRQQIDLPTAERCGKADREAIAVPTQVDHMVAPRQYGCQRGDVVQEILHGDCAAGAPGED